MNKKVHQTLVWLNLLSFRTKDLAEPTIGIQSAAANQTHCSVILTLSHQRTHCTVPAVTAICRTGPACSEEILSSVARWQKFRPKSSKGAAEKKKFWPNFFDWTGPGVLAGSGSSVSHTLTQLQLDRQWVRWYDRDKMAEQCVVICSWLYTDCWCGLLFSSKGQKV